jgi:hypothetical protein
MTLEEKLAAIDSAIEKAKADADAKSASAAKEGKFVAPFDPADLTVCEGCQ